MEILDGRRAPRQEVERLWREFILELAAADPIAQPSADWRSRGTAYLQEVLTGPGSAVFVARQGDRLVGLTVASLHSPAAGRVLVAPPYVHLSDLYVEPSCRGQGIGSALIGAVAGWAAERGAHHLDLNVLAGSPAEGLYRRCGFVSYRLILVRPLA